MPEVKPQKIYKVLKIDQMARPRDEGGIEMHYRIQYRTKGGVVATTEIAEEDYTEEKVNTLLTKLAEKHDKILAL